MRVNKTYLKILQRVVHKSTNDNERYQIIENQETIRDETF